MKKIGLVLLALLTLGNTYAGGKETAHQQALKKWQEMRFGLFIHWGPVSLKGTEIGWSRGGDRRGYAAALQRLLDARPDQLPPHIQRRTRNESVKRVVCDYLAGMTDRYAIEEHTKLFDPALRP